MESGAVEHISSQQQEELIANFVDLTGASVERAKYFLEAAAWNLEVAAGTYFESQEEEFEVLDRVERPEIEILEEHTGVSPVPIVEEPPESNEQYLDSSDDEDIQVIGKAVSSPNKKQKVKMSDRKFATLFSDDKKKDRTSSSDEEEKDGKSGQAFFAGGGQQVLGPDREKKKAGEDAGHLISDIFTKAREHGAEPMESSEGVASSSGKQTVFAGGGYRLGDSVTPSRFTNDTGGQSIEDTGAQRIVTVTLIMWRNGFSLDDGPLRPYDDPENQEFFDSVRKGEIPVELRSMHRNKEIDLHMKNNQGENYKPPPMKPFSGKGEMLGSFASNMFKKLTSESATAASNTNSASIEFENEIDETKPVTAIQIRFADGSRLKQRFNLCHRISDVRSFICRCRKDSSGREFVLMTTFPNRELQDESLTIEEAGLKNAVVMQKVIGE